MFPFVPLTDKSEIFTYITFILCVFVMTSMLIEFKKGTGSRMQAHGESPVSALSGMVWKK